MSNIYDWEAEFFFEQGLRQSEAGNDEAAIASFDTALKFKLDYHETWNNRGVAQENLGRNQDAIASYDKALQLEPNYHEA
ncbi:MAG TPA: tetratricopeptide repeat protein, partial [Cyanophyceae cyanobacterium]